MKLNKDGDKLESYEGLVLPDTILTDSCYSKMFNCCTRLTSAPVQSMRDHYTNWLKSFKERVQPKQEWSEEYEHRINRISDFIWKNRKGDTDEIYQQEQDANWLKLLKDRCTWKPSDTQIASITCAVRKMKESACYDSELVHLLQDLKKLKGE